MPREATGTVYPKNGKYFASVSVATRKRQHVKLVTCTDEISAVKRGAILGSVVARLRKAHQNELISDMIEQIASSSEARLLGVLRIVDEVCAAKTIEDEWKTFGEVANDWTTGELHTKFPGHVRKVDHSINVMRLKKHIMPLLKDVPLPLFQLEHAEAVMRQPNLPAGSRRHVAQIVQRVLSLAVYPVRAIKVSPVPRGWLPKANPQKAGAYLYPDEELKLMRQTSIPLMLRLMCGVLAREGMRKSELGALEWTDLDLERGAINLDENKTEDPRTWALDPGVTKALKKWRELNPNTRLVFEEDGEPVKIGHLSDHLRAAMLEAGVDRHALHHSSETRQRMRAHDLRATFITLSLAAGKSETWVADRTGHTSSLMINRYRRAARSVAELGVGTLISLEIAIPELSAIVEIEEATEEEPEKEPDSSECDGGDLNPQALRRWNLKPIRGTLSAPKQQESSEPPGPESLQQSVFVDSIDNSPTIGRRRRTRLGRAVDDAISAAMGGDPHRIAGSMFRLGRIVPRSPVTSRGSR